MPPPLGDVVRVSVDSGRRVRRRRRLFAGAGGGTAAAVLAFAGLLALGAPSAPSGPAAEEPSPTSMNVAAPQPSAVAPATAEPSAVARCVVPSVVPTRSPEASASAEGAGSAEASPGVGPAADDRFADQAMCPAEVLGLDLTVPAVLPTTGDDADRTTPASALELLLQLLPKGETDGYAYLPDGYAHVQAYLDRGAGPGMIRVYVGDVARPATCADGQICVEANGIGLLLVERDPTDCTRFMSVTLQRRDGVEVTVHVADCLMWDGGKNPAGAVALDLQEAVTVVLHPAWGPTMPASLIKSGTFSHPKLNPIVGG